MSMQADLACLGAFIAGRKQFVLLPAVLRAFMVCFGDGDLPRDGRDTA